MNTKFLNLIGFLILVSCEPPTQTYKFRIINNSDKYLGFYKAVSGVPVYPDTLIESKPPYFYVNPNSILYNGGLVSIEDQFKKYSLDTLSIYLFDVDTINFYPWETIREEYKVLKRYDLSLEDIQLLDYEISYPPTEQMKEMRMYPRYEE